MDKPINLIFKKNRIKIEKDRKHKNKDDLINELKKTDNFISSIIKIGFATILIMLYQAFVICMLK